MGLVPGLCEMLDYDYYCDDVSYGSREGESGGGRGKWESDAEI